MVEELIKVGGRKVYETLFTQLKSFFGRITNTPQASTTTTSTSTPTTSSPSPTGGVGIPKGSNELGESARNLADRLLFRSWDLSIEASRTLRARAADEYITACKRGGFPVSERATPCLQEWLKLERAGPVQGILSGALLQLEKECRH
jgi:hypothetical protein